MSKLELLQKRLVKYVIIAVVVIALCGGVYFAVDDMSGDALQHRSEAEAELTKNQGTRDELKAKIDAAAQSEKKYLELLLAHTNPSFEAKREDMLNFLRDVKAHARLNDVKVTMNPEVVQTETALTSPNHEVTLRDNISIEFGAISDLHVYAMLNELLKQSPGFVTLKAITIDMKGDLSPAVINRLATGEEVDSVGAKAIISWAGIRAKEGDQSDADSVAKTPTPAAPNAQGVPPGPGGLH